MNDIETRSLEKQLERKMSSVYAVIGTIRKYMNEADRGARKKHELTILSHILHCSEDAAAKIKMGFVAYLDETSIYLLNIFMQVIETTSFEGASDICNKLAVARRKGKLLKHVAIDVKNVCFAVAYNYKITLKDAAKMVGEMFHFRKSTILKWMINTDEHPRVTYVWCPAFIDGCMKYGVKRSCRAILSRGVVVSIAPGPSSSSSTTKKADKPDNKKEDGKESGKRSPRLARARKQQRSDERAGRKPPVKRPTLQDRLKGNVPRSAAQRRKARTRFRPTLEDRLEMARASKPGN